MSSNPSTSGPTSNPTQDSIIQSSTNTTSLDRQLVLRQIAMICTSTQMLAETLTATYISAAEPLQAAWLSQRLDVSVVANQLNSLTATLRTLSESLLAASVTIVERLETEGANKNAEANDIEQTDEEQGAGSERTTLLNSSLHEVLVSLDTRECSICMEDRPLEAFPKATDNCDHEPNVCGECIKLWLQAAVEDNIWIRLTCMGNGCDEQLQHADWQRLATAEFFGRYDDLITKHALGENADFRHCLNPDCNSGHEHIPGPEQTRAALFICNDCGYRSCATHNGPWHEGESCEEYGLRMDPAAQETASLAEIARVAKACPGNGTTPCGVFIIKNGGCAHMTCTQCEHQFCYFCLAVWNEHEPYCEEY